MTGEIRLEHDGDRAIITLDQPERLNALSSPMWTQLRDVLGTLGSDPPRVLILTGTGEHFCAGMDLQPGHALLDAILETAKTQDIARARAILTELGAIVNLLASFPAPTIAAIEGVCVGAGLELALACDLRVMSRAAVVGFPETRIGFIPDIGGTARAIERLGAGRAALLVLSGRRISGEEAARWGLAECLEDRGGAMDGASSLADDILAGSPAAISQALQVLRLAPNAPLADALAIEREAAIAAMLSGDCVEGIKAFFEKRQPIWPKDR